MIVNKVIIKHAEMKMKKSIRIQQNIKQEKQNQS